MGADAIKEILLLEFLAVVGIAAPLILFMTGHTALALFVAGAYWALPAMPIPIIHLFSGGWMPFSVAYPMSLLLIFTGVDEK